VLITFHPSSRVTHFINFHSFTECKKAMGLWGEQTIKWVPGTPTYSANTGDMTVRNPEEGNQQQYYRRGSFLSSQ